MNEYNQDTQNNKWFRESKLRLLITLIRLQREMFQEFERQKFFHSMENSPVDLADKAAIV